MQSKKINEFKNYLKNAGEETEGIEEIFENEEDKIEFSKYLQNLRSDCKQAIRTLKEKKKDEYEKKLENLTKALEIIYLFA